MSVKHITGSLILGICISAAFAYWHFISVPEKEMELLTFYYSRTDAIYQTIKNPNTSTVNAAKKDYDTEVVLFVEQERKANELKKMLISNGVSLRSEKAKETSKALINTADCLEKLASANSKLQISLRVLEQNPYARYDQKFIQNVEKTIADRNAILKKLDDEMNPLLEGYFR